MTKSFQGAGEGQGVRFALPGADKEGPGRIRDPGPLRKAPTGTAYAFRSMHPWKFGF
jgi:hypothetical protein